MCHALTIVFYNFNSHLVVCRLKYLGFQYYHEWNSGSTYVRQVWRGQRGYRSWIVKRYGKYRRKASWIAKRYGKCGRKVGWIVKWYENMEERQVE